MWSFPTNQQSFSGRIRCETVTVMKKIIIPVLIIMCALCSCVYAEYIEPQPELTVFEAMGIQNIGEIKSGYIMNIDKQKATEMTEAQIVDFCNGVGNMKLQRRIVKNPFCGMAVVLRTDSGEKTYYYNSGVQLGMYGDSNFLCYVPYESNAVLGELYASFMSSKSLYNHSLFVINDKTDYLIFPGDKWAVEEVLYGASNSLIPYEITLSFGKVISREEFCMLVANYLCVCGNYYTLDDYFSENGIAYHTNYFADTNGCDNSINMLYAMGIVNGKSTDVFGPGDALTREETAIILKNAAMAAGMELKIGEVDFADMSSVSKWATDAVKAVGSYGVMSGTDGEFRPKDYLTTEQAITGINKLFKIRN